MRELTITKETFTLMILELIKSGVTFTAKEESNYFIKITFTGGY